MQDHLIKFGSGTDWFPNEFLTADGFEVVPNQRTDLEAYRDANIDLHRVTSSNYKTSITLTLCPMCKTDKEQVFGYIRSGIVNAAERKAYVEYYNDETDTIDGGYFYLPDITFKTLGFFGGERWYASTTVKLIEY